ncbi:MAG: glycosyltransferase family 2 protein [Pseudomonadota bacterium]
MSPAITVCIPAYQAEPFLAETLASVRQQSHRDLKVLVSVDRSGDGTAAIARHFAQEDPRFEVLVQAERLGWLGNVNHLLDRVATPFFSILPHDDLLQPVYFERLLQRLDAAPEAVAAYSDIERFGLNQGRTGAPLLAGPSFERALAFLGGPLHALPFRGLVRSQALARGLRLRDYGFDGFFTDQLWVFELLCLGPCLALPEPLYRKRVRAGSVVRGWERWPSERKAAAWQAHLEALLRAIDALDLPAPQKAALVAAARERPRRAPEVWRYGPFAGRAVRLLEALGRRLSR